MPKSVAILGSSYLLPSTPAGQFGRYLLEGKNLISTVQQDRWSQAGFVHPQKSHPGTAYTFSSGSVGDVSQFDAAFFGISPREAAQIDPQQRVLLELSWQAFEDAGLKPSSMRGSACGVYIGIASADYSYRLAEDLASIDSAVATGNTASIAANRLSYFFDLRGPSMAIDTACSSSLVAFHQACQAIRAGEITHALTGGISLHLHPYGFIIFSKASMLSPIGNCNVFDEAGEGYVRSEGGGIFVLKDYDLAVADGDRILAVVAQTAVNTDGKKAGLTIPKPEAQAELLSSAYASAGITPDEISYIEAHGTGTAVGDPIETLALGISLGQQRPAAQPLPIGSVKSNLGHLEAASGVAGLAKALFVIEQRKIPPTIGITTLNPRIDFKGLNLEVVTQTRLLPDDKPVVVGVNSFGFGGANAHVILRSPKVMQDIERRKVQQVTQNGVRHDLSHSEKNVASAFLQNNAACEDLAQDVANAKTYIPFLLSAATPLALQAAAAQLSLALTEHVKNGVVEPDYLYEAAYQLAFRREAFEHRAVVFASIATPTNYVDVAAHSHFEHSLVQHSLAVHSLADHNLANHNIEALSQQLTSYAAGVDNLGVIDGISLVPSIMAHGSAVYAQGPAFFYSGNGAQWLGMGRKLLAVPIFKQALEDIDQTFVGLAGFSITEQLQGLLPELSYENTDIAQPALFALQVGVTKLLAAMGVRPQAVAGHSVGEVAAAWAAGILDLKSTVQVIYHRSRLQQTTKGRGNMTAVAVGVDTATRWLSEEGLSATVCIAGVNSFCGVTLAGTAKALTAFEARLTQERVGFKRLELDYAFHSPAMDGIQSELEQALSHLAPTAGAIPFYSAVTGALLDGTALTADYWWQNIRQPVLFERAAQQVLRAGHEVLVEIGPHPVLRGYLNDCVKQQEQHAKQSQQTNATTRSALVLPSLSRQQDDSEAVQAIAARTWIAGAELDLSVLFPVVGHPIALPSYPWQKERHWHSVSAESPNTLNRVFEHPLLGYRLPQHELLWENQLDLYRQPFLADHVVGEAVVFPGTGYVELALAAAHAWHAEGVKQLEDLEILSPITFNSSHGKVLRVGIDAADGRVTIQTRDLLSAQGWTLNARARIILEARFPLLVKESRLVVENDLQLQSLKQLALRSPDFDAASHLRLTRQVGLQYGKAFQALKHGWLGKTSTASGADTECATALFEIPESLLDSLERFKLHPALLDCSLQLIIQLLRDKVDLSEGIAFVPIQVRRISLQPGLGAPHHVTAHLLRKLTHSLLAEFTVFDAEGRAIARLEGARFRRVRLQKAAVSGIASGHDLTTGTARGSPLVNTSAIQHIHTRYIPLPLQPGMHPSVVSYQLMLEAANAAARRNVLDRNYRTYVDELDPLLDTLCNTFAVEALAKLGFNEIIDHNNTLLQNLIQQSPDTAPLLQHLLHLAVEEGRLIEDAEGVRFFQTELDPQGQSNADKIDALNIWNTLLADYPDYFAVVHTVGKVGQHLSRLVRGEQSLTQVLGAANGVAALTDELVGHAVKARLLEAVKGVLNAARQQLTPAGRLGFLEVAAIKPALACELDLHEDINQSEVIFACPELSELATRHQLVEDFPRLRLAGFAERAEGAEAASQQASGTEYRVDLAIVWLQFDTAALNTLALDYALRHLKPGGTLLVAGQHRTRWLDFTFGGRADWWLVNADQKTISMQRDRSLWESRLASLGLEHIQHIDTTQEAADGAFLLVAHHPLSATTQAHRHELPRSWLLVADDAALHQPLRDALCAGLQGQGDIVSVCIQTETSDEIDYIAEHLNAMHADFGELDGIIHLKGLGAAYQASTPASGVSRSISAANLLKACQRTNTRAPVWFITQGAHTESTCGSQVQRQAFGQVTDSAQKNAERLADITLSADVMLSGFIRTLGNEVTTNRVQQLDLNATDIDQDLVEALINELALGSDETEVVLTKEHGRFVPRLTLGHPQVLSDGLEVDAQDQTLQLNFSQPGQLRNLQWQWVKRPTLGADEVEIKVEATGLNFRDVMYALGLLSDEAIENGFAGATIGLECSGEILHVGKNVTQFAVGDRVVGFGPACFAEHVVTKAAAISHIPRALSSEAAATIPSTFLTSYYALVHLGRLEPGEKILIHGGAGGVGLAAIQIARCCGAEIFATAGSDEKRELLRMMGVDHVLDSRSLGFAEDIMTLTNGVGIDMVLNSLAGEAINRNLSILKPFGRFLELGKRDFYDNTRIGLRPFRNNITYFGIDADQLMNERPELTAKLFGEVMDLFEKGVLHALPYTRFEAREVVEAFRFMQQSQQIGKIVVTYRNGIPAGHARVAELTQPRLNETPECASARLAAAALQTPTLQATSFKLDPQAIYLVTGGLGGFGLRSALWLAEKGARQLLLLGRRGPDTAEAREGLETLAKLGVTVCAHACDITDEAALSAVLGPSLPQLKGVIHAAAVIEDSLIENLSPEQFARVLSPKLTGALNLHRLTQQQPLDFFVLYSSATTLFGNPGQAAYIAVNCGLEALALQRRAQGLTATCMLWGALDDTGFLARHKQVKEALQHRMGGRALSSAQALERLEQALSHNHNHEGVLELDFSALAKFLPTAQTPRFSELARLGTQREQNEQKTDDIPRLLQELDDTALAVVFMAMVKQELSQILRLAPDKIQTTQSIYDIGLDSLMGVELVVALEARFGVRLSVMAISEHPTIEKLTQRLLGTLRAQANQPEPTDQALAPGSLSTAKANSYAAQVADLVKIHGSDSSEQEIAALAESLGAQTHQAGRFLQ